MEIIRITVVQPPRRVMSLQFRNLYRVLCLVVATQSAAASEGGGLAKVRPSDCKPRDADSTCATAVVGAPVAQPPAEHSVGALYDGPLAGVPASGYAYWGFDFFADQYGYPSLVRQDEFINRSNVPVTIKLSFTFPTSHPCNKDCFPGVQFQVDAGWYKVDPPYVVDGSTVSVTSIFKPGQGYGWVIALWQSSNPRLTVSVPQGSVATLEKVGMPTLPAVAGAIAATNTVCECWDGATAACSYGSRFSNGLLGSWAQSADIYARQGAFTDCPVDLH